MDCDQFVPHYTPQTAFLEDYKSKTTNDQPDQLPNDWPRHIISPMAWSAEELHARHIFLLSDIELNELSRSCKEYSC